MPDDLDRVLAACREVAALDDPKGRNRLYEEVGAAESSAVV
jgi:hypothetical protein